MSRNLSLQFTKYHGTGNDFILIDNQNGSFPVEDRDLIRRLCHRKLGIGADGMILLCHSLCADFLMRIFNQDGSEAQGCGNGLRCLIRFIQTTNSITKKSYQIEIGNRIVEGACAFKNPVINLGKAISIPLQRFDHPSMYLIDIGALHIVQFVPNCDLVNLSKEGTFLRQKYEANVNFATVQSEGSIRVRTFEKGVEGETLSCGTGAAAVAVAAKNSFSIPMPLTCHFPGGKLQVEEQSGAIYLTGSVEEVFQGVAFM